MRSAPFLWAIGIAGLGAGCADAQTGIGSEPFAAPIVGQVSLARSPLSTMSGGNSTRFTLVPSVRTVYDSNVLRYANLGGNARDNIRVTPGVDFSYRRLFGRTQLSLGGSAGYDYNSRFRFLNRSRIQTNASARTPVGALCSTSLNGKYEQRQFDLGNTQATAGSTQRDQTYDVTASCERLEGFSPMGGFTFRSLGSSGENFYDYNQFAEQVGIQYNKPSVGTITVSASAQQLRRPHLADLIGVNDDTNLRSVSIGLNRSVSPHIKINIAGGVTNARPTRAGVSSFFGASYDGQIEWLPTSRFAVTGTVLRQVTNQNGISATYVIQENYGLSADWMASAISRFRVYGSRQQRVFRGENLTPTVRPLRSDRTSSVAADYRYNITRDMHLGLTVSRRWRKADNSYYNYKSTQVSTSIGAEF